MSNDAVSNEVSGDDDSQCDSDVEEVRILHSVFSGFGYQRDEANGCFRMLTLFYAESDYDSNEDDTSRRDRVSNQCQEIWKLRALENLQLHRFPHPIFPEGIGNLTTLKKFDLVRANRIMEIPSDIGALVNLTLLVIEGCDCLETLPDEIGDLASLEQFEIRSNHNLQMIPATIRRLQNLTKLTIFDCDSITSLPSELGELGRLESLFLSTLNGLQNLPAGFGSGLQSLLYLSLYECQQIVHLEGVNWQAMCNLATISITGCRALENIPMGLKEAKKMKALNLSGLRRDALLRFFQSPWNGESSPRIVHLSAGHDSSSASTESLGEFQLGNDYGQILPGLPDSLDKLDLGYHSITRWDHFLLSGLPRKLIALDLEGNPILKSGNDNDRVHLQNLLESYTQLGYISPTISETIITPSIAHTLLLNRCGKILLVEKNPTKPFPLSMWPTVLEKVNETIHGPELRVGHSSDPTLKQMEASVMYSLLRGPALLGRLAEGHDLLTTTSPKRKRDHSPLDEQSSRDQKMASAAVNLKN